jgi:hypothetical protein
MWKHTLVALTTLAALTTAAHARPSTSSEVTAAMGGLITGVLLADAFDNANVSVHFAGRHGDSRYDDRYGRDSRFDPRHHDRHGRDSRFDPRHHDSRFDPRHHDSRHDRGGYYVWETRRTWIPGYWENTRDCRGRRVKVWVEGRYEVHRVKVWVSHTPSRRGAPYCG